LPLKAKLRTFGQILQPTAKSGLKKTIYPADKNQTIYQKKSVVHKTELKKTAMQYSQASPPN
jgi:hypothetical protein